MSLFLSSLSAETIKSKNTFALWLIFIGGAVIPLTVLIAYGYNWQLFIPQSGQNPWKELFERSFNGITLFTPLFIVLIIGLLINIENKSNSWKHILVLPISKSNIYLSKYLFLFSLILIYFFVFVFFTWGIGILLAIYKPQLNFANYTPQWVAILAFLTKFFAGIVAIIAIHFWLCFKIKNLIASLGFGLAGIAFAILFNGKVADYNIFYPYSFPIFMLNYKTNPDIFFEKYHYISLFYFVLFSGLSYWDFTKRFKG